MYGAMAALPVLLPSLRWNKLRRWDMQHAPGSLIDSERAEAICSPSIGDAVLRFNDFYLLR